MGQSGKVKADSKTLRRQKVIDAHAAQSYGAAWESEGGGEPSSTDSGGETEKMGIHMGLH